MLSPSAVVFTRPSTPPALAWDDHPPLGRLLCWRGYKVKTKWRIPSGVALFLWHNWRALRSDWESITKCNQLGLELEVWPRRNLCFESEIVLLRCCCTVIFASDARWRVLQRLLFRCRVMMFCFSACCLGCSLILLASTCNAVSTENAFNIWWLYFIVVRELFTCKYFRRPSRFHPRELPNMSRCRWKRNS